MRPQIFIITLGTLCFIALCATAQPTPERGVEETLVLMRDHLSAMQSYEATVTRTTIVSAESELVSAEVTVRMAWERPNRVHTVSENPLSPHRVICDGETLAVWQSLQASPEISPAPITLAEIDAQSEGLASSGLAIGGLFFSDDPLNDLAEGFDSVHDLGIVHLEGAECRLIGFDEESGLRMIMWIDRRTWLPRQVVLDASSTLRDLATVNNLNNLGAKLTITERHREIRINALDHSFALPGDSPE